MEALHYPAAEAALIAAAVNAAECELWLAAEREHRSATLDHVFERAGELPGSLS